jgi:hypothetical protein
MSTGRTPSGSSGERESWADRAAETAIDAVVPWHMPARSLALYARWWQLENWLRQLAYTELRAAHGISWVTHVKTAAGRSAGRQAIDSRYVHMASVDGDNPIAYLDYKELCRLITSNWELFDCALFDKESWEARQSELLQIRHRIGHMRRPHEDDLNRIEQILRDLERGTFITLASYNRRYVPDPRKNSDPITVAWIREEDSTAKDLINHAARQYEIQTEIEVSRRPWAEWQDNLACARGILWHVQFRARDRAIDIRSLWYSSYIKSIRPLIVHMLSGHPGQVEFTFSAVDDPRQISDAIEQTLKGVLRASAVDRSSDHDERRAEWSRGRDIDFRVLMETGWNIVDVTTLPITNFNAGGSVASAPEW